jgi:fatty acid desaturase
VSLDIRRLTDVQSGPFKIKLLILICITAVFVSLVLLLPAPFWIAPSLLLGLMYAHAVELQHQCLHNTALKSRPWNRRVGVSLGLPLLVSFSDYQHSHMRHHKLLGTPEDKEFFNYGYEALTTVKALIPHIFMVRHNRDLAVYLLQSIFGGFKRDASPKTVSRIRNEYRLMALFLGIMAIITIVFQTPLFLKLWLIPFVIAVPTHALIELPEHIGCNVKVPDVLSNTRTISAGKFGVWFTDGNNYHVEHHWLPGVPNHKFPDLHKLVSAEIKTLDESYWAFYREFLKRLYRNTFPGGAGKRAPASST